MSYGHLNGTSYSKNSSIDVIFMYINANKSKKKFLGRIDPNFDFSLIVLIASYVEVEAFNL